MSMYALARATYRWVDRVIVAHLPGQVRLRQGMFHLARRLFPDRIQARSAGEFIGASAARQTQPVQLPEWAREEVAQLVQIEPALAPLVAEHATLEAYFIPWDMDYVGKRYAAARRQLHGPYVCMVLSGAQSTAVDMVMLAAMPRPLAVIDVVGDDSLAALSKAAGVDYVALPAEHLDSNDHCAVLARLVLQLAPRQVRVTPHPVVRRCIARHGLALASTSALLEVSGAPATKDGGVAPTAAVPD